MNSSILAGVKSLWPGRVSDLGSAGVDLVAAMDSSEIFVSLSESSG